MSVKLVFLLSLFFCFSNTKAQQRQSEFFLGVASPFLDNGLAFDLGLRSSLFHGENLSLAAQIGFGQYRLSEFLSGTNTKGNYSGLMIGPSITFLKASKIKPTLLLLGGAQGHYQKSEGIGNKLTVRASVNTELNFTLWPKLKLGIFAQSPGFIGFRCVYKI